MSNVKSPKLIRRYTAAERTNHWIIALAFILLALSGLALFHPSMYWMTALFGGGTWTRILHPFVGVFMFLLFFVFAARMFRHNKWEKSDSQYIKQFGDVVNNREDKLPEVGRYNGGQKALFFALIVLMLGLLVTGIVMWRSYFDFGIELMRLATVLHAIFAFLIIIAIIVHIYAGFWVKGSVQAMTRGTVTPGWAWKHHRAWFRQVRGEPNQK